MTKEKEEGLKGTTHDVKDIKKYQEAVKGFNSNKFVKKFMRKSTIIK